MSDFSHSERLKIYLLRLSQTNCDDDVKHFIKYMYKSDLSLDLKNKIYPIAKILRFYYSHPDKDNLSNPYKNISSPSSSPSSSLSSSLSSSPSSSPSSSSSL